MVVVLDKDVLLVIIVIIPFRVAVVMVGRMVCVLVVVMGMEIQWNLAPRDPAGREIRL